MKRKFIKKWETFVEASSEFLAENMHKSRVTLKYRNKAPSNGRLYATNDQKSYMYKFTEKSDIDKLDSYIKSLLYLMTNKPIDSRNTETSSLEAIRKNKDSKKKGKKGKKH